jgi:hypothetical protein
MVPRVLPPDIVMITNLINTFHLKSEHDNRSNASLRFLFERLFTLNYITLSRAELIWVWAWTT